MPPPSGDQITNARTGTSSLAIAAAASSVMFSAVAPPQKKRLSNTGRSVSGDNEESRELDSIDQELELVKDRDLMARTIQKFLVPEAATTFQDRLITGGLIVLTALIILALFLYQNAGPGFQFKHVKMKP